MNKLHLITLLILTGSIKLGFGQSPNSMYIKYPVFLFENEEELEDDELDDIGIDKYASKDISVFLGKEVTKENLIMTI